MLDTVNKKDEKVVNETVYAITTEVNNLAVTSEETKAQAGDLLNKIRKAKKLVDEKEKEYTAPLVAITKKLRDVFRPHKEALEELEGTVSKNILTYQKEEDARAKKEEQKIADRVERGTMRMDTAEKKLAEIDTPAKTVAGNVAKTTIVTRKVPVVENLELVPREYLVADMAKIKEAVSAGVEIPGVKVEEVQDVRTR